MILSLAFSGNDYDMLLSATDLNHTRRFLEDNYDQT